MKLIESLEWRYATKKFDPTRKVSEADFAQLQEAIRLSASSYGLQLYKVLVITDPELREKLKPASWGQPQITDASHLLVFCNIADVKPEHINAYVQLKAETQGLDPANLQGYADFINGKLSEQSAEQVSNWTARQVYIALGNLLAAAGELKIDACPMEGFEPDQYDEILGLSKQGLRAAVLATIGYRSDEDATQHGKKVRKPVSELFEVR